MTDVVTAPVAAPVTAPVVEAPVVAPAAPAVPEPQVQEYTFEETGDANVDYALGIIGKAGIGLDHPAAQAARNGDFSQLQHILASKGIPGADTLVGMLKTAYDEDVAEDQRNSEQIQNDIIGLAGSAEHWNQVAAWAKENGEPEELETLNGLLGNPKTHKIAARYLLGLYDGQGGEKEPEATVANFAPANRQPAASSQPLDRVQFAQESEKLRRQLGPNFEASPQYKALTNRVTRR